MSISSEHDNAQRHKERMQRKKEVVDRKVAEATELRGVLIVLTGLGKGKSTSGFGAVVRALGHGLHVGVVQFIKGTWDCGERSFLANVPGVVFHVMGTGFTWETQDRERDLQAARESWAVAKDLLEDETVNLVLLDELTYMLKYRYLDKTEIISTLKNRPLLQHVIITGRGAPPELMEIADTVSEVKNLKHAFASGVKAQPGLDW